MEYAVILQFVAVAVILVAEAVNHSVTQRRNQSYGRGDQPVVLR